MSKRDETPLPSFQPAAKPFRKERRASDEYTGGGPILRRGWMLLYSESRNVPL